MRKYFVILLVSSLFFTQVAYAGPCFTNWYNKKGGLLAVFPLVSSLWALDTIERIENLEISTSDSEVINGTLNSAQLTTCSNAVLPKLRFIKYSLVGTVLVSALHLIAYVMAAPGGWLPEGFTSAV